jgi:hypothetical protein
MWRGKISASWDRLATAAQATTGRDSMKGLKSVGAVAMAIALLGTPAFGAGLTTSSETVTLDGETPVTAECPGKRKAVSGGFAPESLGVPVSRSSKAGKRGWTAEGLGFKIDLTVYAYCSRRGKNPSTTSAETTVPAGEIRSLSATCEPGTKVVSGGFFGENGFLLAPNVGVHESRKTGARSWTVSGGNSGSFEGDLIAYANCREGKGLKSRSKTISIAGATGMQADPSGSVVAKCKRGTRAMSGGFAGLIDEAYLADQDTGPGVIPSLSRRAGGRKWETGAVNDGGESGELTSYVYCQKKPKRK